MNPLKFAGTLALAMVFMTAASVLAQQPQPGMMMKDDQMGGMQQRGPGMGMMKQGKEMGGMQGCMMMEEMKDQQQLMREMKKHMRMMDEMMEMMMMMQRQQGMTPPGSESEPQEHHPGESK